MWDFVTDIIFELLPRPVQRGCLVLMVLFLIALLGWIALRWIGS